MLHIYDFVALKSRLGNVYIVRTQLGGEGWFGNCVLLCTRGEGGSSLCVRTYSKGLIKAEKRNAVRPFEFLAHEQ